jgi:hypothetical protein
MLKTLLGEKYTEEIAALIGDKQLAVVNDGSWIPKDKFNATSNEAKELKKLLADRDNQLEALKGKAAGNEDLLKQLDDLKTANAKTQADYDARLRQQALDHAIDRAIAESKGRNPKAIKALLNLEAINLDGENILGLSEQLKAIQESDGYLFGEGQTGPVGGGTNPPGGGNTPKDIDQQIEEAIKAGDIALSLRLKNQKYFKE